MFLELLIISCVLNVILGLLLIINKNQKSSVVSTEITSEVLETEKEKEIKKDNE